MRRWTLLLGVAPLIWAQGTAGYDFLRLRYTPLSAHFGDGWVGIAGSRFLQDLNPAFSGGQGLQASVVSHVSGIRGGSILWAGGGSYTLSAQFLHSGEIPKTDESGTELGTFSARFLALQGMRSVRQFGDLTLGVGGKLAFMGVDDHAAFAVAADLGFGWKKGLYNVGLVLRNIGWEVRPMGTDRFSLPMEFLAGASVSWREKFIGAAGVSWSPHAPLAFSAGFLFMPSPLFGLGMAFDTRRRGLVTGGGRDILAGLSAALSFRVRGIEVDYTYTPFGDLGDVHRVGISRGLAP